MKYACLLISSSLTLAACASSTTAQLTQTEGAELAESIKAFETVCLKSAPSFSGAAEAAKAFGISEIIDARFMKMGLSADKSIGVQTTYDEECVITTPAQRRNDLTAQFLGVVSRHTNTPPLKRAPSKISINGATFIVQHDRTGGETFVMLRTND
ncbi:MAG: hypothetical protein ACK4KV_06030 [Rhodocyclaceae bacterium]